MRIMKDQLSEGKDKVIPVDITKAIYPKEKAYSIH